MENTELQAIEDSKLLRRGTKVIHNGQKCVVLNFRHNGKGYEYFLSDRKWVKRHQVREEIVEMLNACETPLFEEVKA